MLARRLVVLASARGTAPQVEARHVAALARACELLGARSERLLQFAASHLGAIVNGSTRRKPSRAVLFDIVDAAATFTTSWEGQKKADSDVAVALKDVLRQSLD